MSVWISKFKANNQTNKKCQHIESLHGPAFRHMDLSFHWGTIRCLHTSGLMMICSPLHIK